MRHVAVFALGVLLILEPGFELRAVHPEELLAGFTLLLLVLDQRFEVLAPQFLQTVVLTVDQCPVLRGLCGGAFEGFGRIVPNVLPRTESGSRSVDAAPLVLDDGVGTGEFLLVFPDVLFSLGDGLAIVVEHELLLCLDELACLLTVDVKGFPIGPDL